MLKKLANHLKRLSVVNKVVVAISCVVFCWYSIPRAIATFGSFVAHEPSLSYDYSNFEDLLPSSNSSLSKIREGIPHGFQESGSFYLALWFTFTYRFDGYYFKYKSVETSEEFNSVAESIHTSTSSFSPYRGPKLCGGFHADYMLTLKDGGELYHYLVCFGCHEVLLYSPRGNKLVELEDSAYNELLMSWEQEFK